MYAKTLCHSRPLTDSRQAVSLQEFTALVTSVPAIHTCERSPVPGYHPGMKLTYQTHGPVTYLDVSQVSDFDIKL